jgi:PAS domain S-box-containing protein
MSNFLPEGRLPEATEIALERLALDALNGLATQIAVLDAEGIIVAVNKSWRAFARRTDTPFHGVREGDSFFAVCAAMDAAQSDLVARGVRAVSTGRTEAFTHECRIPTGSDFLWFLLRVTTFPGSDLGHVIVSQENITDLKRAEAAVRQHVSQLHLFEQVIQNISDALLITEAEPLDDPGPRIVYANPAFARMTGYTAAEIVGQTPRVLQGEKTDRAILDRMREALRRRRPVQVTLVNYRKDGTEFDVEIDIAPLIDESGAVTRFVAVQRDVTDRILGERERRAAQERFEKTVEMSPGIFLTFRLRPDGTACFPYASPRIHELYGLWPEELREDAAPLFARIHPDDLDHVRNSIAHSAGTLSPWRDEFRILNPEKGTVWVEGHSTPIPDPEDPEDGIVWHGVIMDITERKRAEEERSQLQALAQRRAVTLEAARRVALDVLLNRTGVEALKHIADAARQLVPARYAALGIADTGGERLKDFIAVGIPPAEEHAIGTPPTGRGILGQMLTRTEPLRLERLDLHPDAVGFPPHHPFMQGFLGVPIRRDQEMLGSLYLTDRVDGKPFNEADEAAIVALADYAAVALHYQQLLQQQTMLTHGFINTLEEERRSVAYEIHDGLTQYVFASFAFLNSFAGSYRNDENRTPPDNLEQGLNYLERAVIESRRLVNGLRSLALEDMGLAGAMEQLIREEEQRAGWEEADFQQDLGDRELDRALETAVYRVAQEALANVRKHARTTRVRVRLLLQAEPSASAKSLVLEVRDWGQGFEPEKRRLEYDHLGLHSMEERVRLMKGTFSIRSEPQKGTCVRAVIPLPL